MSSVTVVVFVMPPCLDFLHAAHFPPVEFNSSHPPIGPSPPSTFASAGDISGAVQTLRALLLFYPSDKDSLDNLQLYSETLGGDTESQGIQPSQVHLQTMQCRCSLKHLQMFSLNYSLNFRDAQYMLVSF